MTLRTRRRQRAEMMLEMMRTAREPILLMNLKSKCNMDWTKTQRFSKFLVKKGLMMILPMIEEYKETRDRRGARSNGAYLTTQRGVELLERVERSELYELFTYR